MQNYTNRTDNAVVSNGTLQIITKAESFGGSAYTSARLLSKDKFSFKYGKIEALAKLTERVGTWTAIWMLGNNISTGGWPACGEIDTMAHAGKQFNEINGCFHHPGHSGGTPDGSNVIILKSYNDDSKKRDIQDFGEKGRQANQNRWREI